VIIDEAAATGESLAMPSLGEAAVLENRGEFAMDRESQNSRAPWLPG